ncbi:hypothetical protein [Rufibacter psychrotolerans]|uniref:hypothetical protein n=1 Tax=Rufibacter psychrotolerans TaxID=2812556 RepID=UPI00196846A2|nr:hypothetical protein [Rufibacter sp. SYSU D00308]
MEVTDTVSIALEGKITTCPSGYRSLVNFYKRCSCYYNTVIFIDFKPLYWFDANLSALLQAILYKLNTENNLTFSLDVELVKAKYPILFRNGFLANLLTLADNARSTVRSELFYPNDDVKFCEYIEKDLLNHPQMTHLKCEGLDEQYLELFSNIQKHAATTDPVFVCGQFYQSQSKLNFTIVDLGQGFLPPIHKFTNGAISNAKDAIEWSLAYGHTTKGEVQTGGLGLYHLFEHCKNAGGAFNIITGGAYWGNNLGEMGTRDVPEFVGTAIHLIYNCG